MDQIIADISGCIGIFHEYDQVWPEGQMVWLTGYHCPPNGKDREKFRKTLFSFIDTAMTYDFLKYDADFVFQWSDEFKGYRIGMMNVKPFRIIAPK